MSEDNAGEIVSPPDGAEDCEPVVAHDLTPDDIDRDVELFSALANETRYEVLRYLLAAEGEICACQLVPRLEVNQSTTSRALKALYGAGLVDRRKDGRWRYYTTTDRAETLLSAIDAAREQA